MRIVFVIFSMILSLNVFAFDYSSNNRIFVGMKSYYRHYSEKLVAPKKSDEYGLLYGLNLGYQHKAPNTFLFEVDIDLDFGSTTYDGALQDWDGSYLGPWKDKTNNVFLNFDSKLGYTFYLNQSHLLTPFLGYGMHAWGRGLPGETETYGLQYASFGMQYDYTRYSKLQYGLHLKFMPMLYGEMDAEFATPHVMTLGNKLHFEISAPIVYKFKPSSKNHLRFTPYYRNQKFGQSNDVSAYNPFITLHEPASQNHVVGLKIDYGFGL